MNLFYCSPRQRMLLNTLVLTDEWFTGPELSKELGVSDRTVRNDVGILNYVLEQYNASIVSERGKGYRLQTNNKELLISILAQYEGGECEKEERVHKIIIRLLFSDGGIDLCDLEEALFISRTTLENEIKTIRKMLENFYPFIDIKRNSGIVELVGSEMSIRFLLNEILMLKYDVQTQKLRIQNDYFSKEEFESIMQIVVDVTSKYSLSINDQGIADIAAYLVIAKRRACLGKMLDPFAWDEMDRSDIVDQISHELYIQTIKTELISDDYGQMETSQIALKLSFVNLCSPFEMTKAEAIQHIPDQILIIVNSLIVNIKNDFNLDLSNDEELFMGLVFHIRALMNRVKYQQMVESPILEIIKKQYPFIFELSLHIYEIFGSVLNIRLTESELSYVAAHIAAGIERMGLDYGKAKIKIAVVSHLATSYSQLLVSNLKTIYGNNAQIVGPYPTYKMEDVIKTKPSIVLTTNKAEKERIIHGVRIMNIGSVLSTEEQLTLTKTLEEIRKELVYKYTTCDTSICTKFNKNLFYPELKLTTPQEVLEFMSNMMMSNGYVPGNFLAEVMAREKLSSTVLDNMVAIPHPVKACAHKTVIGVASLIRPILWGGNKVQLVFMLAIKRQDKAYMREFFSFISKIMDDDKKVVALVKATTYKEFMECVKIISGEGSQ
ncbi:MAG: BglG family transcription antiterminator [Eubacteriales bacterium]